MYDVAVLVGSLRDNSSNMRFARALAELAAPKLRFRFIDLTGLPRYDDSLWNDPPAPVLKLKAELAAADAVLFVTPEYNRSIPGILKDAIDWPSRPYGDGVWSGKPAAIAGATPGVSGTAAAQGHLRSILPMTGIALMGTPEIYFQIRPDSFDEAGNFADGKMKSNLSIWVDRFSDWIARFAAKTGETAGAEADAA